MQQQLIEILHEIIGILLEAIAMILLGFERLQSCFNYSEAVL